MIRGAIWLVAAGLFAAAIHLAYVLFLPPYEMKQLLGQSIRAVGVNTFGVLEPGDQELILKESGRIVVAGLCPFDLKDGTLVFDATLPDAIWSFTIYAESGRSAYAINETQAGTNSFRLVVKQSPGLLATLNGEGGDSAGPGDGWTATSPSRRGLAIVWVALDDRALRSAYTATLKQSTCRIERAS